MKGRPYLLNRYKLTLIASLVFSCGIVAGIIYFDCKSKGLIARYDLAIKEVVFAKESGEKQLTKFQKLYDRLNDAMTAKNDSIHQIEDKVGSPDLHQVIDTLDDKIEAKQSAPSYNYRFVGRPDSRTPMLAINGGLKWLVDSLELLIVPSSCNLLLTGKLICYQDTFFLNRIVLTSDASVLQSEKGDTIKFNKTDALGFCNHTKSVIYSQIFSGSVEFDTMWIDFWYNFENQNTSYTRVKMVKSQKAFGSI